MRDKVKKPDSQDAVIDAPLHVLGYKEDGYWLARALEVSALAHGDTFDEALQSLKDALQIYFEASYVDKDEDSLPYRAENRYWKLFYKASKPRLIMKGEDKKEQDYYAVVIHQPVIDPDEEIIFERVA